jgi:hypothetical protein
MDARTVPKIDIILATAITWLSIVFFVVSTIDVCAWRAITATRPGLSSAASKTISHPQRLLPPPIAPPYPLIFAFELMHAHCGGRAAKVERTSSI